jgi:DNA-binding NarL/FixJ family response regulator
MSIFIPHSIRLLLVKDEAVLREGLRLLLNSQAGIIVVGEAANCSEAVATAVREQPDIVLLDSNLGDEGVLACIREIRQAAARVQVIILTGDDNLEAHYSAISQGAKGLVRKSDTSDVLVNAIKKVYAGEVWLDGTLMARVLNEMWILLAATQSDVVNPNHANGSTFHAASENGDGGASKNGMPDAELAKIALLTEREREIVTLIGEGLKNKEIAGRLFISGITVRHHLSSIYNKLEVSDRFELAIYAFRYGLAKLPV